ncbi:SRPBCC family protein [Nocardioides sp.]|uniref:SRPBCC family protein n=1 Tax=Nocardioides sp. TaxID=35761 RepID=UPI003D0F82EC
MLSVSRQIEAPAAALWSLLVDVSTWPEWGPSVADVELSTSTLGAGSRGRVRTAVGLWLPFEVTGFDPGSRWSWSVSGIPATSHSVRATGTGRCRVSFGVPWWAPAYLPVCAVALRRLDALATIPSD